MIKLTRYVLLAALAAAGCHDEFRLPDEPLGDAGISGFHNPETTLTKKPALVTNQRTVTFEFTSDAKAPRFECVVDRYAKFESDCKSPYTVTVDQDGAHTIEVTASDDFIPDVTPEKYSWTVDTVAPHTILAGPSGVDNSPNATFYFEAEADATATCTLDDRLPVTCTSPYHAPTLADGPHHFSVFATDAAGNSENPAPSLSWVLDSTTSDTVIDSGPSGLVTEPRQVFTFSSPDAAPGATFRCLVDGQGVTPCSSPLTVEPLAQGLHTFRVQVVETTGNVDPTPAARDWTLDSVAPSLTITAAPPASSSHTTATFEFVTDASAAARECRLGTAAFAACTSPVTLTELTEGTATFEVRVRDAAGNVRSEARSFTVDTTPPVVTITSGPGDVTNNPRPTFEFTAPGATTTCQILFFDPFACTSPYRPDLGRGTFTLTITATDAAGNTATTSRTYEVDTTAPSLTLDGPFSTADATPTYTFTAEPRAALACSLDGAAFAPCASPLTTAALALGFHQLIVRATDLAGNVASRVVQTFVDPRPLAVAITAGPFGEISQRTPTLTWTSTGAITETCRYDAASFDSCAAALATVLADGPHTFEVRVTNDLVGPKSATRSFTVDTVAPLATITDGPTGTITTASVGFGFTTSGNPAATECRLLPGGTGNGPYAPCTSPTTLELPAAGAYVFEVRVRDAAGNQWSAYRDFTYAP